MTTPDQPDRDDDRLRAGEYALGLLPEDEAAAFEDRLARDPELRAFYARWAEDFAAFTDDIDPVAPPARVRAGLRKALFGARSTSFWRQIAFYALGGAVAAGLLYIATVNDWLLPAPDGQIVPELTAELRSGDGALSLDAAFDAETGQLFLARAGSPPEPGRAFELWLIAGEAAPVSLGVLPGEAQARLPVSAGLRGALPGAVLAVSDEPAGGSPTGAPTGAVLALAELAAP